MTALVVLQPSYLPWVGYFDQIEKSDIFVFYDDVQFDKEGWRNRNRVKGNNGPLWLTVPVLQKGRLGQSINDVEINNSLNWSRKHICTIRQYYARAPYLDDYFDELSEFLSRPWGSLAELDIALIEMVCSWLGIMTPIYRSSELSICGDRNERLLNICHHFDADRYISGSAAKVYLDVERFEDKGIQVEWHDYQHPTYDQLHGEFTPYMSVIDLLLNQGKKSLQILKS